MRRTLLAQTPAPPLSTEVSWPAFCYDKHQGSSALPFNRFSYYTLAASKYSLQFPVHALSFIIRFLLLRVHKLHGNSHSHRNKLAGEFTLESPVTVSKFPITLSELHPHCPWHLDKSGLSIKR